MLTLAEKKIMKELKELGFEYLPTFREVFNEVYNGDKYRSTRHTCDVLDMYGDFIDQQPKLGDFIPCVDGVPVDEPKFFYNSDSLSKLKGIDLDFALSVNEKVKQYQKALEQVKFEGFRLRALKSTPQNENICVESEDMAAWFLNGDFGVNGKQYETYEQAINYGVKFKIK